MLTKVLDTCELLRYLKGSIHIGLTCNQQTIGKSIDRFESPLPFGSIGYVDSNFAGDPEDRRLVMGYCFFMA